MAFELFNPYLLPFVVLALYSLYSKLTEKSILPEELPWVGKEEGFFSKTRARLNGVRDFRGMMDTAHEKYSKKGLHCILATMGDTSIQLPSPYVSYIINSPDNVLGAKEVQHELLETQYTTATRKMLKAYAHEDVIRRVLTRQLGNLTTEISSELSASILDLWGTNTEDWKDVVVFESCMEMVSRTSNRVFVGEELCRNKPYLAVCSSYARLVAMCAYPIRCLPNWLKPILGPLFTLPLHQQVRRSREYLMPLIQKRMADLDKIDRDPDFKRSYEEPNDFVQWSIHIAKERYGAEELDPIVIAGRILLVNFAAIHTSTITITSTLFDIFSAPPSKGFVEGLREEAARVLAEDNGVWTRGGLAKMIRIDSAIRESLRFSGFVAKGLVRKVIPEDGVTLPNGQHIKKGNKIGISAHSIHHDPEIYENPWEYDAFRFSRQREELMAKISNSAASRPAGSDLTTDASEILAHKNLSLVTTSDQFLAFGHGRHACPGRFFAANELKLLIAYIVLNYDIQPIAERPKQVWMTEVILPPMKAKLRVRRRKDAVA